MATLLMIPFFAICALLRWFGWMSDRHWAKVKWGIWRCIQEGVWSIGFILAVLGTIGMLISHQMTPPSTPAFIAGVVSLTMSSVSVVLYFWNEKLEERTLAAYAEWKAFEEIRSQN